MIKMTEPKHSPEFEAAVKLMEMMWEQQMSSQFCTFCHGMGHHAKECSTKRKMDTIAKANRSWKAAWGTLKGFAMSKRI